MIHQVHLINGSSFVARKQRIFVSLRRCSSCSYLRVSDPLTFSVLETHPFPCPPFPRHPLPRTCHLLLLQPDRFAVSHRRLQLERVPVSEAGRNQLPSDATYA